MLNARKTLVVLTAVGMVLAARGAAVAATYTGAVQADGPLAYYRLDETGSVPTTADDATTNNNDGTYQNQLVLGTAGPRPADGFAGFSATNTAPAFNKQGNDYITMPSGFLPTGSAKRTIEGWFYSTDDTHNHDQTFFNYGPNTSGRRISIAADNGRVTVAVSGHNWGKTGLAMNPGWHHVAVVLPDGESLSNKFKLYVDGAQLTGLGTVAGSTKTINTTDSARRIGRSSGSETYSGQIDEVAVYGTDLSAGQIRDHYLTALVGGDTVLLHDHFLAGGLGTGDTGSVNGGFNKVTNSAGGAGSASEAGTNASVSTSVGGSDNTGIVSINTFDPTADPTSGFTATWVITSASDPEANGINLTLQSDDGFFNVAAGRPNLLFRFDGSNDSKFHLLANDGSTSVDLLTADAITMSQVTNGFTLTATLNAAGWSYSTTGLGSLADNSGTWTGTHNYSTLFDSNTYVGAFIQTGNSGSKALAVDRITVTQQAAPIPEPATMIALFAAITGLGGYMKKRKHV